MSDRYKYNAFLIIMIRLYKQNIYKIWLIVLTSWLLHCRSMLPQTFSSSSFSFVLLFLHSTHSLAKSQLIAIVSSVIRTIQRSRDTLHGTPDTRATRILLYYNERTMQKYTFFTKLRFFQFSKIVRSNSRVIRRNVIFIEIKNNIYSHFKIIIDYIT